MLDQHDLKPRAEVTGLGHLRRRTAKYIVIL